MPTFVPRRLVPAVIVCVGLLPAVGCATVTSGGGDQTVRITSSPPGADVLVDGKPSGQTPVSLPLARKTEHLVEIAAPGYATAHVTVRRALNPWLLGNLILGGPLGLIVDVISDASHRLSPNEIEVQLRPLAGPPG